MTSHNFSGHSHLICVLLLTLACAAHITTIITNTGARTKTYTTTANHGTKPKPSDHPSNPTLTNPNANPAYAFAIQFGPLPVQKADALPYPSTPRTIRSLLRPPLQPKIKHPTEPSPIPSFLVSQQHEYQCRRGRCGPTTTLPPPKLHS